MRKRIGNATIGDNSTPFEEAYKKMRVVCQIVHNRLEFLKDNLRKARNAETEADRHEGLFEARGEINFIQAHTKPLQATYHGYSFYKEKEVAADGSDIIIIKDKHGDEIAEAEKLILELNKAEDKASEIAKIQDEKWGANDSNK